MRTIQIDENYILYSDGRLFSIRNQKFLKASLSKSTGYYTYSNTLGTVHRLLANYFLGGIPPGMVVNHKDGNKTNNDLSNLEIITHQQNTQHAYDVGLAKGKPGESNAQAKLTESQCISLCNDLKAGLNNTELGLKYGLHSRYVSLIRHGKRWKHLYEKYGPFNPSQPTDNNEENYIAFQHMQSNYTNKEISDIIPVDPSTISLWRRKITRKL